MEDYHYPIYCQNKLFLFGQKFFEQPSFNWGHRVVYRGSYALSFCLDLKQWQRIEFPSLSEEENLNELLFTNNDNIYLILYTSFGEICIKSIYKWNETKFEKITFEGFDNIKLEPRARVTLVPTYNVDSKSNEVVLLFNGEGIHVVKLTLSSAGTSLAKYCSRISDEANRLRGEALSGYVNDNKLAIGFGVHGCGFRWERNRLIIVNLDNSEAKEETISGDSAEMPKFCFSGAKGLGIDTNGSWIHSCGTVQIGMTGGKFDGSVWRLNNVLNEPKWEKLDKDIPESMCIVHHNSIYSVSKENVYKYVIN